MKAFKQIKGCATNKGRARFWIECPESDLAEFGIKRGDPIDIEFYSDHITIRKLAQGKRVVPGKNKHSKKRGNYNAITLDICFPMAERVAMFGGHPDKVQVLASPGELRIVAIGAQS